MENGFSLFLSSLPFTERSMLPLWTSSSLAACLIRFLAPPLPAGWRPAPTPTSSRRRSSRLRPQWWIPGWWFRCSIGRLCEGFFRGSLLSLALLLFSVGKHSPSTEPSATESTSSLPLSLHESNPPTTSISSLASLPDADMLPSLFRPSWPNELLRGPLEELRPASLRDSHSARNVDKSTVIPWN